MNVKNKYAHKKKEKKQSNEKLKDASLKILSYSDYIEKK